MSSNHNHPTRTAGTRHTCTAAAIGLMLCIGYPVSAQNLLIRNAHVISMAAEAPDGPANILILQGRITFIGAATPPLDSSSINIIDAQGDYVLPGLADMHVHLPDSTRIDSMFVNHIAAGVTQIRVMNSASDQLMSIRYVQSNCPIRPKVYYSHLVRKQTKLTEQQADSLVRNTLKDGLNFIKLYGLSDEPTFDALMNAARQHQVIVCGHYPRYAQNGQWKHLPMEKVLKSGFKSIEHLAGYDQISNDSLLKEYISITKANGVYNCPTLDWDIMAYDLQYPSDYKERLSYRILPRNWINSWEKRYQSSIEKAGGVEKVLKERDSHQPKFRRKQQILLSLYEHKCPLILGGDAGNLFQADGFNLYDEMKNWADAGLDNRSILQAATLNAAKFFHENPEWGTIEPGKLANLVLLKKNPLEKIDHITTIYATIVEGKVYYKNQLIRP